MITTKIIAFSEQIGGTPHSLHQNTLEFFYSYDPLFKT